jgi:hypothetical protein
MIVTLAGRLFLDVSGSFTAVVTPEKLFCGPADINALKYYLPEI